MKSDHPVYKDKFSALQHLQKLHIKGHQKGVNYFIQPRHILLAETCNQYITLYFLYNNKLEHELYNTPMIKFWKTLPHDTFVFDNQFYIINWSAFNCYNMESHSVGFSDNIEVQLKKPFDFRILKNMLDKLYKSGNTTSTDAIF